MNSSTTIIKNLTLASLGVLVSISGSIFAQNFTDVPTPLDSSNASYPLSRANSLQWGHHQVQTLTDLYAIPVSRLTKGMLAYVVTTDETYRLITSPTSNPTSTSDRVLVSALSYGSGAGGGGSGNLTFNSSWEASLRYKQWSDIYNTNIGWNVGIGIDFPTSTLTVVGSLSVLRGTAVTIPIYGTSTYRISSNAPVEYVSYNIPSGTPRCSCEWTSDIAWVQCTAWQTVTNTSSKCLDYAYEQLISSQCEYGDFWQWMDYYCNDIYDYYYNVHDVVTTPWWLLGTITKEIKYLTITTGNNTIEIWTNWWNEIIFTWGQSISVTSSGTKTIIRGDLEISQARALTWTPSINQQSLSVWSDGKVYKWKRFFQEFLRRSVWTAAGDTHNLRTIDQWFCYLSKYYHNSQWWDNNANIEPWVRIFLQWNQWKMQLKQATRVRRVEWWAICVAW